MLDRVKNIMKATIIVCFVATLATLALKFMKYEEEINKKAAVWASAAALREEALNADNIRSWKAGEKFPTYDVDKECSAKLSITGEFDECISSEMKSYQKAKTSWSGTTPEIRVKCAKKTIKETSAGRIYYNLSLCIDWGDMFNKIIKY